MSVETAHEVGLLAGQVKRIADIFTTAQHGVIDVLPALVGYWPMAARGTNGLVADHGTSFYPMDFVGTVLSGYDGNSFVHLGDGANYLFQTLAGQVEGTEAWVDPSIRGMTIGGWFSIESAPITPSGLVSKDGLVTDRAYALVFHSGLYPQFFVSPNGASSVQVNGPVVALSTWHFFAGRFTPSTEIAVFSDGTKATNAIATPASINVASHPMEIGRYFASDSRVIHAKARDVFICAAALSDELIEKVRAATQPEALP